MAEDRDAAREHEWGGGPPDPEFPAQRHCRLDIDPARQLGIVFGRTARDRGEMNDRFDIFERGASYPAIDDVARNQSHAFEVVEWVELAIRERKRVTPRKEFGHQRAPHKSCRSGHQDAH